MPTAVARADFTKDCWTVFTDSTTAKTSAIKDWFKAVGYVGKWWKVVDPKMPSNLENFLALGAHGKNIFSTFELFKNVPEIGAAFLKNKSVYKKLDAVCRTSNNVADLFKVISSQFDVPHMKHIEGVSGGFTFVGAVNNAIEHGRLLSTLDEEAKKNSWTAECRWNNGVHQVINLISDLAYMIFGALAVAVWLGLLVVPTVAILLPLTVALVCSLTNYYFKNVGNLNDECPEQEKALKAVKYVENLPDIERRAILA